MEHQIGSEKKLPHIMVKTLSIQNKEGVSRAYEKKTARAHIKASSLE